MTDWFLYMLLCADESFYTGITTNPVRREAQHNNKKGARSIYGKLPAKLVYVEKHTDKITAAKSEREIKDWNHSMKLSLLERGTSLRSV
jgi:putative endonuclease